MQTNIIIATLLGAILLSQLFIHSKLKKMANEIEDLTAEVEETKGIMASAKVLIEGFAAALAAAGTDPAKLAELKSSLDSGSSELAAAITANPLPGENPTPTP